MDGGGQAQPQRVAYVREKSEGLAAVLSFVWAGLGQIYAGRVMRGFGIMVLGIVLWFVAIFLMFFVVTAIIAVIMIIAFWIWNVMDAYKSAQRYNDVIRSTGNRPW